MSPRALVFPLSNLFFFTPSPPLAFPRDGVLIFLSNDFLRRPGSIFFSSIQERPFGLVVFWRHIRRSFCFFSSRCATPSSLCLEFFTAWSEFPPLSVEWAGAAWGPMLFFLTTPTFSGRLQFPHGHWVIFFLTLVGPRPLLTSRLIFFPFSGSGLFFSVPVYLTILCRSFLLIAGSYFLGIINTRRAWLSFLICLPTDFFQSLSEFAVIFLFSMIFFFLDLLDSFLHFSYSLVCCGAVLASLLLFLASYLYFRFSSNFICLFFSFLPQGFFALIPFLIPYDPLLLCHFIFCYLPSSCAILNLFVLIFLAPPFFFCSTTWIRFFSLVLLFWIHSFLTVSLTTPAWSFLLFISFFCLGLLSYLCCILCTSFLLFREFFPIPPRPFFLPHNSFLPLFSLCLFSITLFSLSFSCCAFSLFKSSFFACLTLYLPIFLLPPPVELLPIPPPLLDFFQVLRFFACSTSSFVSSAPSGARSYRSFSFITSLACNQHFFLRVSIFSDLPTSPSFSCFLAFSSRHDSCIATTTPFFPL